MRTRLADWLTRIAMWIDPDTDDLGGWIEALMKDNTRSVSFRYLPFNGTMVLYDEANEIHLQPHQIQPGNLLHVAQVDREPEVGTPS